MLAFRPETLYSKTGQVEAVSQRAGPGGPGLRGSWPLATGISAGGLGGGGDVHSGGEAGGVLGRGLVLSPGCPWHGQLVVLQPLGESGAVWLRCLGPGFWACLSSTGRPEMCASGKLLGKALRSELGRRGGGLAQGSDEYQTATFQNPLAVFIIKC